MANNEANEAESHKTPAQESIELHGEKSYYYWHNKVAKGNSNPAPILLRTEKVENVALNEMSEEERFRYRLTHANRVQKYVWYDDGKKVKVQVEMTGVGAQKDSITCIFNTDSFDLFIPRLSADDVTTDDISKEKSTEGNGADDMADRSKDWRLHVELRAPILSEKAKCLVKENKIVLSLPKVNEEEHWYDLMKNLTQGMYSNVIPNPSFESQPEQWLWTESHRTTLSGGCPIDGGNYAMVLGQILAQEDPWPDTSITVSLQGQPPPYYIHAAFLNHAPVERTSVMYTRMIVEFLAVDNASVLLTKDTGFRIRHRHLQSSVSCIYREAKRVEFRVDASELPPVFSPHSVRITIKQPHIADFNAHPLDFYFSETFQVDQVFLASSDCAVEYNPNCNSCMQECKNGGSCGGAGVPGQCECLDGWTGPTCEEWTCVGDCAGGNCVGANICQCDAPKVVSADQSACQLCGDNVREGSEQCDGSECCTQQCQFIAANTTVCRASVDAQCDLPEYCSGESGECPEDTFLPPSTYCDDGMCGHYPNWCLNGTCSLGPVDPQCKSNNQQRVWGNDSFERVRPYEAWEELNRLLVFDWETFRFDESNGGLCSTDGTTSMGPDRPSSTRGVDVQELLAVRTFDGIQTTEPIYVHLAIHEDVNGNNGVLASRMRLDFKGSAGEIIHTYDSGWIPDRDQGDEFGCLYRYQTHLSLKFTNADMPLHLVRKITVTLYPTQFYPPDGVHPCSGCYFDQSYYDALFISNACPPFTPHCDACSPPCENGGTCVDATQNVCACAGNWQGNRCEVPICTSGCNGGTCIGADHCQCDLPLQPVLGNYTCAQCGNGLLDVGEECESGPCCDPLSCTFLSGNVCREVSDPTCDVEEVCSGTSSTCPPDAPVAAGTVCDDNDPCTGPDFCSLQNGTCVGAPVATCMNVPVPHTIMAYSFEENTEADQWTNDWRLEQAVCLLDGRYMLATHAPGYVIPQKPPAVRYVSIDNVAPPYYFHIALQNEEDDRVMVVMGRVVVQFENVTPLEVLYRFDSGYQTAEAIPGQPDCTTSLTKRIELKVTSEDLQGQIPQQIRVTLYPSVFADKKKGEFCSTPCYYLNIGYDALYVGTTCSPFNLDCDSCDPPCQNGGSCGTLEPGVCTCLDGYAGTACEQFSCSSGCPNGVCVGGERCNCTLPYIASEDMRTCQLCGNGEVEGSELCDGEPCCDNDCQIVGTGSSCDDGNTCTLGDFCDGMSADCTGGPWNTAAPGCESGAPPPPPPPLFAPPPPPPPPLSLPTMAPVTYVPGSPSSAPTPPTEPPTSAPTLRPTMYPTPGDDVPCEVRVVCETCVPKLDCKWCASDSGEFACVDELLVATQCASEPLDECLTPAPTPSTETTPLGTGVNTHTDGATNPDGSQVTGTSAAANGSTEAATFGIMELAIIGGGACCLLSVLFLLFVCLLLRRRKRRKQRNLNAIGSSGTEMSPRARSHARRLGRSGQLAGTNSTRQSRAQSRRSRALKSSAAHSSSRRSQYGAAVDPVGGPLPPHSTHQYGPVSGAGTIGSQSSASTQMYAGARAQRQSQRTVLTSQHSGSRRSDRGDRKESAAVNAMPRGQYEQVPLGVNVNPVPVGGTYDSAPPMTRATPPSMAEKPNQFYGAAPQKAPSETPNQFYGAAPIRQAQTNAYTPAQEAGGRYGPAPSAMQHTYVSPSAAANNVYVAPQTQGGGNENIYAPPSALMQGQYVQARGAMSGNYI